MDIALIAAMSQGRVIGNQGHLPWMKISADMKRFVQVTKGKPVIMGRKTLEDIGGPLKDRINIVLSRYPREGNGVHYVCDKTAALEMTKILAPNTDEVVVIGGETVFKQFMDDARTLYITLVKGSFIGDTMFPEIDMNCWSVTEYREIDSGENTPYPLRFITYKKLFRENR